MVKNRQVSSSEIVFVPLHLISLLPVLLLATQFTPQPCYNYTDINLL